MLIMGNTYADMGDYDKAIKAHEDMVAVAPWWGYALGVTYVRAGMRDKATGVLAAMEAQPPSSWQAYGLAILNGALGNMEAASQRLEYDPHHAFVAWIAIYPELELLHADPHIKGFYARLNLPGGD